MESAEPLRLLAQCYPPNVYYERLDNGTLWQGFYFPIMNDMSNR